VTATRTRLTRAAWTDAALATMAAQGPAGVNIEQLARRLGTTKGSFYHHFSDRQALLVAALKRFEEIVTTDIAAASNPDPRQRLIDGAVAGIDTELDGFVELALATSADDPTVAATLERVTAVRLDWLVGTLKEAGVAEADARVRAEAGLATYLGLFTMARMRGRRFGKAELRAHIVGAVDAMLA